MILISCLPNSNNFNGTSGFRRNENRKRQKKKKKKSDKVLPFLQFTKLSETALSLMPQPLKTKTNKNFKNHKVISEDDQADRQYE